MRKFLLDQYTSDRQNKKREKLLNGNSQKFAKY